MKKLEEQPWWTELVAAKDSLSLRQLAERFGASPAAISNALKRNGIPRKPSPAGPRSRHPVSVAARRRGRQSKLDQYADEMGTVVDREIAAKAGVTVSAVTNYRRRNNIKAAARRGRPRLRREPITGGSRLAGDEPKSGYKVLVDGETFVVVAGNITEAAATALASGLGEVTCIEWVGRILRDG